MVKKTVVQCFCDDCYKELYEKDIYSFYIACFEKTVDLCLRCVSYRLNYSFVQHKSGLFCEYCRGKGNIKEWTGVGTDYNYDACPKCHGEGIAGLK